MNLEKDLASCEALPFYVREIRHRHVCYNVQNSRLIHTLESHLVADTGRGEGARVQGHLPGEVYLEVPLVRFDTA